MGTRLLGGRGEKDILHCCDSFSFFFFSFFLLLSPVLNDRACDASSQRILLNTKLCAEVLMRTRLPGGRGERDTAHCSIATRV